MCAIPTATSFARSTGPSSFKQRTIVPVNIRPTLLTAAMAGIVAAVAWPFVWAKFGGPAAAGGFELIVATLLVIALPAHAFVVGFVRTQESSAHTVDTALLKRIGAWLAAAAATTALRAAVGI